ncbi:MAG: nitronate monooxygenase [Dehalococcoidia bacterium]|nr:nitronate monooxygenase [Dehalococcoidia bacterium]
MIETPMTELFGCKHPVMLAGMNWITTPKLVAAVCNAGGLGIFATARCTPDEARKNIQEIRSLTDKPFGINQILMFGQISRETIQMAIEEKVPIINYTLGKPWFIEDVHKYGGKVIGTTATVKHAIKAVELGCDAITVTGLEAAAHGEEATILVLLPIVASKVKVPIIAAGGFQNGGGLIAALALGASGISMGTRFALTQESPVHDNFKQYCLKCSENDTLRSDRFDGLPSRMLKTPVTERLAKSRFPLAEALVGAKQIKEMLGLSLMQFMGMSITMMTAEESHPLWTQARQAASNMRAIKGIYEGDMKEGIFIAGQAVGACNDLPPVQDLMDRVISEAESIIDRQKAIRS